MKDKNVENKNEKKEMGAKLKELLSHEIQEAKQREKTRGAEILAVFAKHNFYATGFTPLELRTTLEDMGPTFVKIGQIMSSRVDLLPESYCKELGQLRANVKPLDAEVARAVIEEETGQKIEDIFQEFRDEPLGSASIAQAHYGVLKDGREVVTKVQRPLIADMMRQDFVLLKKMAKLANTVSGKDDGGSVDLVSVFEELEKVTEEELDFRIEAENTRYFKEHCIEDETVLNCPTVIDEYTTERIMTMTFVDGYSISKRERLLEDGCDLDKMGEVIVANYVHQVLDVGCFHADPHQGNIMVSKGVPYWIDFGMIGHVSDSMINVIQEIVLSLVAQDLEGIVNGAISMGAAGPKMDRDNLVNDLDAMMHRYMSVTNLDELDIGALFEEMTDLMAVNDIKVPGEYTILVRSIITIEGVIEELCPKLNLFTFLSEKFMERAKKSFDLEQEIVSSGKEILAYGKKALKLPLLASDALSSMAKGRMKMKMELTGYEKLADQAGVLAKNLVVAAFACILFLGSCILCTTDMQPKTVHGIPVFAVFGLIFSIALGIYAIRRLSKKR